jgi:Prokaryotic RING finger family 1
MARCSICYTVIRDGEPVTDCPECKSDYHKSCWDEIGGCGTYGCKRAAVAQKPPLPVLVGAGWGDIKSCPSCHAEINSSLLVCSCGAKFPWADPMTGPEYSCWIADQQEIASSRTRLAWLFVLSMIGVAAPITGPIAGIYAYKKRKQLAGTGGTYLAMGYGSAALGSIYTLLIVLSALGL